MAAYDMRPRDPKARSALIDVCWRRRIDADARARTRDAIGAIIADTVDVRPGDIVKLAQLKRADGGDPIPLLCQAIALDENHRGALAELADSFAAKDDYTRAAGCKLRLARATEKTDERFALLLETADLWEKKAQIPRRAAHVLEEALAVKPGDVAPLRRLVVIYGELSQWDKLVDALRALADAEQDADRKTKNLYALAQIVRDKIGDARRAVELYDEVLDLDETRLDAFERVVRIFTELRDWEELRIAYTKMIGRVHDSKDTGLKHALYHQLGLVYRDRLGDAARALDAFRCASRLEPNAEEDRAIVLELLVVMDQVDVAVATARTSLRQAPERAAIYRDLYGLFLRQRAADKAWCAANVIAHVDASALDDEKTRFLRDYPPYDVANVPGTLATSAWASHVMHPGMDPRLTAIFRIVAPAILRMRLLAVPERDRVSFLGRFVRAEDSPAAARIRTIVDNVAEVLGLPSPALYERPTMPLPLAVAPAPTPALFVSIDAAAALPTELLTYIVARRLAELRPELAAHALFPTVTELKSLLRVAMRAAVAGVDGEGGKPAERALARALDPKDLEALRDAVSSIIDAGDRVDIKRWVQLADVTLARAGLLVVGDVDIAWRASQREARSPGDITSEDWQKELFAFAVSDEYADLRGAIGVSLDAE
jgi:tetratricopeptide (TPR) repeat protein